MKTPMENEPEIKPIIKPEESLCLICKYFLQKNKVKRHYYKSCIDSNGIPGRKCVSEDIEVGIGECRKNSPVLISSMYDEDGLRWPVVYSDEWCGEFKKRE